MTINYKSPPEDFNLTKGFNVYRNLNVKTFTSQAKQKNWKVLGYSQNLLLINNSFKVREGGRQKVIEEKRKNVHAWIHTKKVIPIQTNMMNQFNIIDQVYYDPYTTPTFITKSNDKPIHETEYLVLFYPHVYLINEIPESLNYLI